MTVMTFETSIAKLFQMAIANWTPRELSQAPNLNSMLPDEVNELAKQPAVGHSLLWFSS